MTSSDNRKKGMVVSYVYSLSSIIVSLIYVPLLLQGIGAEEYGLYQLVGSVMAYLVSINGVLSAGVGRFYCLYRAQGDTEKAENTLAIAKRLYAIISIFALVATLALIALVKTVYSESFSAAELDELAAMLLVLGLNSIVTMFNTISIAVITAFERFVFLKLANLVALIAQPVIVYTLLPVMPNALMVTCVVLGTNILCAFSQYIYVRRGLSIIGLFCGWDKALVRSLLCFSGAIVMVTIADQIFWRTDQLIVGYIYGATAIAVYSVGAQIYSAYMSIGTVASSVFLPRVSELYLEDDGMEAISGLFAKVGRITFLILGFVLGGFITIGSEFITLWAGEGYFESYLVAVIVMVPFTIDLVQGLGLTILQVANKYYFRGVMYLVIALANIVLTIVFLNLLGIPGAALSTGLSMLIGNGFIMNWFYWKRIGLDIPFFWKEVCDLVVPMVMATVLASLIYELFSGYHGSWFSVAAFGLIYAFLYAILQWKYGLNDYEKKAFSKVFHRRRAI